MIKICICKEKWRRCVFIQVNVSKTPSQKPCFGEVPAPKITTSPKVSAQRGLGKLGCAAEGGAGRERAIGVSQWASRVWAAWGVPQMGGGRTRKERRRDVEMRQGS